MESNVLTYIIGGIAFVIGIIAGKLIFAKNTKRQIEEAEQKSNKIIADAQLQAETLKKEKLLEAKEKFVQLKAEHDREVLEKNRRISEGENRVRQKEQTITIKLDQLEKQQKDNEVIKDNLNRQIEVVNLKRTELEKHQEEHMRRLEKIAGLTAEEAKAQLIEGLKHEAHSQALALQQEIIDDAKQKANKEARKIIIQSIQRTAAEQAIENAITVFSLESDEIKGQIIGREGRNIRAIEAATRLYLIVGYSTEAIIISYFEPVCQQLASFRFRMLELVGVIQPAAILELVEKTVRQLEEQVMVI